jgi:hypothetical protein
MTLSEIQKQTIVQIKELEKEFGVRWFVQAELLGVTLRTMRALVEKGYLVDREFNDLPYYQWKGKEIEDENLKR